jgi:hypothetical protein
VGFGEARTYRLMLSLSCWRSWRMMAYDGVCRLFDVGFGGAHTYRLMLTYAGVC